MNAPTVVDAHMSTVGKASGPISAPMVAALETAWAAIRAQHPEVPAAVIVLGAGSIGSAGGLKLGHFAAMRWADPDQPAAEDGSAGVRLPEVFVGGEGLARGPADVLGTLLHEAAHALADVRGIKDTCHRLRWAGAALDTARLCCAGYRVGRPELVQSGVIVDRSAGAKEGKFDTPALRTLEGLVPRQARETSAFYWHRVRVLF